MIDRLPEASASAPESEPLFVNVTRMDREKYFEAVRARAGNARSILLTAGGAAAALLGLFMHGYAVAALGAAAAVLAVLSPALIGRRDFRRLCELHPGGVWEKTLRFYPDRVESDAGGRITSAGYERIRREYESQRMYVLDFGKTLPAAAFDKNGFTLGSMEELRSFLTEVRIAARDAETEDPASVDQQALPENEISKKENDT